MNSKTFHSAYVKGDLRVSQNSSVYNEDSTTAISAWGKDGGLKANFSFSLEDTKTLISHLEYIVALNEKLKPKEPSVTDKISALPVGSVFSRNADSYAKYIKSPTGQLQSLTAGYQYPLSDFENWTTLIVNYDPSK